MRYFLIYIMLLILFIGLAVFLKQNLNIADVRTVFLSVQKNIPDVHVTSVWRNDPIHGSGKALDIGSKNGNSLLLAYKELCKESERKRMRIGIGIENADRHIHIDPFIFKKCRFRFIETSKKSSYCIDHLTCDQAAAKAAPYYSYIRN